VTAPQPASILLGRIALEQRRLERARSTLVGAGPAAVRLESMAGDRLRTLLGDMDRRWADLARAVGRGDVDAARLGRLDSLQRATDRVLSEALALSLGALAREFALDDGVCDDADLLIRELAGRIDRRFARPTVPGEQEVLHRASDVVRCRVPGHGLWDLPVMAHEFGHLVVAGLQPYDAVGDQVRRPVDAWLAQFDGPRRSRAEELFCDMFATYALGPSYVCGLVLHRLDPSAPPSPAADATHPSPAARVHACLWTLRRLQHERDTLAGPYDRVLTLLTAAWDALQPPSGRLTEADRGALGPDVAACWTQLEQHLGTVRYGWSGHVRALVTELERGEPAPAGYGPADVLNAAWISRLESWPPEEPGATQLEADALKLLRRTLPGADGRS
jgi:hypothetical protein